MKEEQENILEIKGLSKAFDNHKVLDNIDLTVKKGENLVVLGRSGMGKSVLIKCIAGLIRPDKGVIKMNGQDIMQLEGNELNEVRRKLGFLFQGGALYDSMSVRENLEFPLRRLPISKEKGDNLEKKVKEALNDVGLGDSIDKMPSELSGGMKKRIALARTIIQEPEIILYDEPTTGLDTITSREISQLILKMQEKFKTSSIIITHDLDCAEITSNRLVILHQGKLIAEGEYKEISKSKTETVKEFFN